MILRTTNNTAKPIEINDAIPKIKPILKLKELTIKQTTNITIASNRNVTITNKKTS